jgi:hypothetical protein
MLRRTFTERTIMLMGWSAGFSAPSVDGRKKPGISECPCQDGVFDRDNRRSQCDGLVEAVVGGVAGGGEGLAAGGTAIALLAAGVGPDVAEATFPPVQAIEVGAELTGRVHRVFLRGVDVYPRGYAMDLFL